MNPNNFKQMCDSNLLRIYTLQNVREMHLTASEICKTILTKRATVID